MEWINVAKGQLTQISFSLPRECQATWVFDFSLTLFQGVKA
ncbi:MAG: hypothetical protein ACE5K2_03120 [Candidatus Zixiibacteriota bacterium]